MGKFLLRLHPNEKIFWVCYNQPWTLRFLDLVDLGINWSFNVVQSVFGVSRNSYISSLPIMMSYPMGVELRKISVKLSECFDSKPLHHKLQPPQITRTILQLSVWCSLVNKTEDLRWLSCWKDWAQLVFHWQSSILCCGFLLAPNIFVLSTLRSRLDTHITNAPEQNCVFV